MSEASATPVLDLVTSMTLQSVAASSLDPTELMVARIAALAAVDAPTISYQTNVEAAVAVGIDIDRVRGILTAIAPIVGTARIASAITRIAEALELDVSELEAEITGQLKS